MAVYTVQPGDTIQKIAQKFGYALWRDLYKQNIDVFGSNANKDYTPTSGAKIVYTQGGPTPGEKATFGIPNLTPFDKVLNKDSYINPELLQGSAEQQYANYYAPIVQKAQSGLESQYAGRNLTRSGLRGQAVGDMYNQYGQEQQAAIQSDVLQNKQWATDDYNRLQALYESTEGKQLPQNKTYTPYNVAKPTTSAGTYGSSYLDWLNRVTRV